MRIGLLLVRQLIAKHRSFKEYKIEVVLLGPGITNDSESILRSFFSKESPKAVVVQHYGGGSGLLMRNQPSLSRIYEKKECLVK
jgi:Mg2+/Co2+ transporter CorC